MDHVQISVEEYNKLRDFYVSQKDAGDGWVCVEGIGHKLQWAKKEDLDHAMILRVEKLRNAINEEQEISYNANRRHIHSVENLERIPIWIRKIFKAV